MEKFGTVANASEYEMRTKSSSLITLDNSDSDPSCECRKMLIKLLGVVNVFEDHSSEVEARLLSFLFAELKNDAVHCNMKEFRSSHGHVTQRSSVVKLYLTKTKQIMILQVQNVNHKPSPNIQIDLP